MAKTEKSVANINLDTHKYDLTAERLANSFSIVSSLETNDGTGFNGTQSIAIGTTGILPIEKGGTGNTTGDITNGYVQTGFNEENQETLVVGQKATSEGNLTVSAGEASHAEGYKTTARGQYSHSEGFGTCASSLASHAEGFNTKALESYAHAEGNNTTALSRNSHAGGSNSIASGSNAFAHGEGLISTYSSAVFGKYNEPDASHIFEVGIGTSETNRQTGFSVSLSGQAKAVSLALDNPLPVVYGGTGNKVGYIQTGALANSTVGSKATAEGVDTVSSSIASHAEGIDTTAANQGSHSEGLKTSTNGMASHAEGELTKAEQRDSHTEGFATRTVKDEQGRYVGAHAEGEQTTAIGDASHAEGYKTSAVNFYSHAEGEQTTANGQGSHSEGSHTIANGYNSHAGGSGSTAGGDYHFVHGQNLDSTGITTFGAMVIGQLNSPQPNDVFEIGYGISTGREANIFSVDRDGIAKANGFSTTGNISGNNLILSNPIPVVSGGTGNTTGRVQTGQESGRYIYPTATAEGVDNVSNGVYTHTEGYQTTAQGNNSHAEGQNTHAFYDGHAEGILTTASNTSHAEGIRTSAELKSHAEGTEAMASCMSHAEGDTTYAHKTSHAEGILTTAINQSHAEGKGTYASDTSHAEGIETTAFYGGSNEDHLNMSAGAHAEGINTWASYYGAHAEGQESQATHYQAHAEGYKTSAFGQHSHTEGYQTCGDGYQSHAEGCYTTANGDDAHAEGRYSQAFGSQSHAEGYITTTNGGGYYSTAVKDITGKAIGTTSVRGMHAEGIGTYAQSMGAHAEGAGSVSNHVGTHAEGVSTTASRWGSHAEGYETVASQNYSHAEGYRTTASEYNAHAEGRSSMALGSDGHAEGYETTASGDFSHSEGLMTFTGQIDKNLPLYDGDYSHAEGNCTTVTGRGSHSEGSFNVALGSNSHVEGCHTTAGSIVYNDGGSSINSIVGDYTHTEGYGTQAVNDCGHAEGHSTTANAKYSHAGGFHTIANYEAGTAIGKYNYGYSNSLFEVGQGSSTSQRKSAFVINEYGDAYFRPNGIIETDYVAILGNNTHPGIKVKNGDIQIGLAVSSAGTSRRGIYDEKIARWALMVEGDGSKVYVGGAGATYSTNGSDWYTDYLDCYGQRNGPKNTTTGYGWYDYRSADGSTTYTYSMWVNTDGKRMNWRCNSVSDKQYWFDSALMVANTVVRPATNGKQTLGTASYRWGQIYSTKTSISTSDRNKKREIKPIDEKLEQIFLDTPTYTFYFKDGDRRHIGTIAQDMEEVIDKYDVSIEEFAPLCKDYIDTKDVEVIADENYPDHVTIQDEELPEEEKHWEYAFRYEEYTMLTVHMVQKLYKQVAEQAKEIKKLKEEIAELKK